MRFQTRHPACVDEWIPVCTGMAIGGVTAVFRVLFFAVDLRSAFSFRLLSRHPRERGEPSYSECCSWVFPLHCQCCWFCFMLLSVVASAFPNVASGVRG